MGTARPHVVFVVSVLLGLAVFATIILPGDGLSGGRFAVAAAAFLVVAPVSAWVLGRHPLK